MDTGVRRSGSRTKPERGVVAIAVAVSMLVLLGIAGLALDLGQLFVTKTELKNAMDACALAAARELNTVNAKPASPASRLGVLTRAESAGMEVAKRNSARFQRESVTLVADRDVMFGSTLVKDGSWMTKSVASAAVTDILYVRCSTRRSGIETWLMYLPGSWHETEDVAAFASASLQPGTAACYLPLGLCKRAGEPLIPGQWYSGKFGVPCDRGVCNFVDIAGLTHNADDIRDVIQGKGVCGVSLGATIPAATGCKETVAEAWNSRFGIYKKCSASPNPTDNAPDQTGYAFTKDNWPTGSDAFSSAGGFKDKRVAGAGYDGSDKLEIKKDYKCVLDPISVPPGADRRLVYLPIIDCPWDGHSTEVRGTACVLLLTPMTKCADGVVVEYIGEAPSDACGTWGTPSGPGGTGPRVPTLVQ